MCTPHNVSAAVSTEEREALLDLNLEFSNELDFIGWNGAEGTECSWQGITCNDTETNVTEIDLRDFSSYDNNYSFSNSFTNLTALKKLNMQEQHLNSDSFPAFFSEMKALKNLHLEFEWSNPNIEGSRLD